MKTNHQIAMFSVTITDGCGESTTRFSPEDLGCGGAIGRCALDHSIHPAMLAHAVVIVGEGGNLIDGYDLDTELGKIADAALSDFIAAARRLCDCHRQIHPIELIDMGRSV